MASVVDLKFEMQEQQQSLWCWAAVGASCALFYHPESAWTQCKIVTEQLPNPAGHPKLNCCDERNISDCNVLGNLMVEKVGNGSLQITNTYNRYEERPISFSKLKDELEGGRPVAFDLQLEFKEEVVGDEPPKFRHFVVIAGCREVGGEELVTVYDPIPGSGIAEMTYEKFIKDYKCHGKWTDRSELGSEIGMNFLGEWGGRDETQDRGEWDDKIAEYSVIKTYLTRPPQ